MKTKFHLEPLQDTPEGGTGTGDAAAVAAAAAAKAAETLAAGGEGATGDGKKPDAKTGDEKDDKTGKGGKEETGGKAGDKSPKAPEKYELTLPDGGRMDASDLASIEEAARAADMSNEDAQAWINENDSNIAKQSARWATETKADKELGGDKLAETQQLAKAGIDRIFPKGDPHRDGFLKFLNRGGAGNNIHVVRAFARIGKLTAEDSVTGGKGGGGSDADPASKLYDNSPKS